MTCCYAIIPDGTGQPAALFEELEDAMDWAIEKYGDDRFRIRYLRVAAIQRAELQGASGPV
jgi:hypothetical protein